MDEEGRRSVEKRLHSSCLTAVYFSPVLLLPLRFRRPHNKHGLHVRESSGLPKRPWISPIRLPHRQRTFHAAITSWSTNSTVPPCPLRRTSPRATDDSPKPDRRNFFTIARGSIQECVPLIEVARRRGFISDANHSTLKSHLEEMAKMISGLIKSMDLRNAKFERQPISVQ